MHIEAKKNIEHALKYAPYNTSFSSIYFWKGIILRNLEETDSAICIYPKLKSMQISMQSIYLPNIIRNR